MEMEEMVHLMHTLRFINPFDAETKEMPAGQKIKLEVYVGASGLKAADIPFAKTKSVTKFLKQISFTEEDVTKTAYYRASYINTRGQEGPASEIFSAVVA